MTRTLVRSIFALTLIIAGLLATAAPSRAQGPSRDNLHTIVADDDSTLTPDRQRASDGVLTEVASSRGGAAKLRETGAVLDREAAARAEDDLGPATAPDGGDLESVIGVDSRYQITKTTSYPYRAIAHVTSSIGGCTGWLIGSDTVATAGHCVHNGAWATNVRVYPGRNGASTPYGYCTAKRLYSVTGWTSSKNRDYDYGAIKLNCTVGNTVGWFGFRWQSASLTGLPSYISGYPGDKAYGTQWRSNDQVRITQSRRLYYANDTFGGMSGSPVWDNNSGCYPCGIAIHAYGVDGTGYNGGTRIVEAVFNNLLAWKNAP